MGMISGVIKVVDKLDTVDTSKADSSLPPPSTGPSCCAGPVTDGSDAPANPSIYGTDISAVPTEKLVNKAIVSGKNQSATFKGIGYELEPLIMVTGDSTTTKLTFDLNDFDNAEGEYVIVDVTTGDKVTSFTAKKGVNEVAFSPKKIGGYAILKEDVVLGIIEVVDNLKTTDVETIRVKYLK
jgi:plastocyanin domain-containing protein